MLNPLAREQLHPSQLNAQMLNPLAREQLHPSELNVQMLNPLARERSPSAMKASGEKRLKVFGGTNGPPLPRPWLKPAFTIAVMQ